MLGRGPSGVYAIISKISGNAYVGSSKHVYLRWAQHKWDLIKGMHTNQSLQAAWNKYGPDGFDFVLLELCPLDKLIEREQHYIDNHNSVYNATKVAGGPDDRMRADASERMRRMNQEPWSEQRWENFRKGVAKKRPHPPIDDSVKRKMSESAKARKAREKAEGRPGPARIGAMKKLEAVFGDQCIERVLELRSSGVCAIQIARDYGLSESTVKTATKIAVERGLLEPGHKFRYSWLCDQKEETV